MWRHGPRGWGLGEAVVGTSTEAVWRGGGCDGRGLWAPVPVRGAAKSIASWCVEQRGGAVLARGARGGAVGLGGHLAAWQRSVLHSSIPRCYMFL
eukprot:scaffold14691_cov124-Isochrysis_galbana.AAC.2